MFIFRFLTILLIGSLAVGGEVFAQSFPSYGVIYNSSIVADQKIALGVNPQGHLNAGPRTRNFVYSGGWRSTAPTGVAYKYSDGYWYDSTSPGCLCEGWGASAIDSYGVGKGGYANIHSGGINNIQVKNFVVDTTSITSTVWIMDSRGAPMLEVTHRYGPSTAAPNVLFQSFVTITNISGLTIRDVRYKRAMDWDISPTVFNELVDHVGVAAAVARPTYPKVLWASDNGFDVPNALNDTPNAMNSTSINRDFTGLGPQDHGSVFTFQFGDLACGESSSFYIYYGAASSKTDIVSALNTVGATVYSLGYSRPTLSYGYFGFGFKGVSGTAIAPTLPTKTAVLPAGVKTDPNIVQTYAPIALYNSGANNYLYQAIFKYRKDKQWKGDILRYNLDTGGGLISTSVISAAALLQARAGRDSVGISTGYSTGGRSIWTVGYDSKCMSSRIPTDGANNNFYDDNSTNLTRLNCLLYNNASPGLAFAKDLIAFVRGKDPYQEDTSGPAQPRSSVLGDTFHSEMLVVGPPNAPFSADFATFGKSESYYRYQKGYASFVSANATRRPQIYVGANDGMLHAFDENLNERWAFIPPPVIADLRLMVGAKSTVPGEGTSNSVFNVDGPITVKDIYIQSESRWKTVLMGGLGWGGKGYYALDITDPDRPLHLFSMQNDVVNKVVNYWSANGDRFTYDYATASGMTNVNFQTLGDAWSRPVIMLLPYYVSGTQNQKWVAVFGAGYAGGASVSGTAGTGASSFGSYVYALDLEPNASAVPVSTGGQLLVAPIAVTPDTASDIPNGVTANLTVITSDGTSLMDTYGGIAYFTDLQGQLWKMNLSKPSLDATSNAGLFGLSKVFRSESTLSNDRMAMNQLATTVVSGTDASGSAINRLIHYYGTGDQTRIQRKVPTINNRIYGIIDSDFPGTGVSVPNQTSSSCTNIGATSLCGVTSSWFADVWARTSQVAYTADFQKVIGRATLYNGNVHFVAYQPDLTAQCPITGASRFIEMTSNCATTTAGGTYIAQGLATAPISDGKGNVYIGIGNLPTGATVKSGYGNVARLTSSAASSTSKAKYKSWREIRN